MPCNRQKDSGSLVFTLVRIVRGQPFSFYASVTDTRERHAVKGLLVFGVEIELVVWYGALPK